MEHKDMKQIVLDYINRNHSVSYAELEWLFEQNDYEYKGEVMACSDQCDRVVFWSGWNQKTFDMIGELIQEGLIHREPTPFFTYLVDGTSLSMPLVKKGTVYKTDHWLPVVFCSGSERL